MEIREIIWKSLDNPLSLSLAPPPSGQIRLGWRLIAYYNSYDSDIIIYCWNFSEVSMEPDHARSLSAHKRVQPSKIMDDHGGWWSLMSGPVPRLPDCLRSAETSDHGNHGTMGPWDHPQWGTIAFLKNSKEIFSTARFDSHPVTSTLLLSNPKQSRFWKSMFVMMFVMFDHHPRRPEFPICGFVMLCLVTSTGKSPKFDDWWSLCSGHGPLKYTHDDLPIKKTGDLTYFEAPSFEKAPPLPQLGASLPAPSLQPPRPGESDWLGRMHAIHTRNNININICIYLYTSVFI